MNNFIPQTTTSSETSPAKANAFSFISKGWREVRDSAESDLRLMKDRANSFKNLASSIDRELENFINSSIKPPSSTSPENDFVKRIQPKLTEFRRVYSSPEFSRKVLEKYWGPATRPRIRIDLSSIRNAMVVESGGERVRVGGRNGGVRFREFNLGLKERDMEDFDDDYEKGFKEWEPIKALKTRLKEFEVKKSKDDMFGVWKNNELVEKLKSSLKAFRWESQDKVGVLGSVAPCVLYGTNAERLGSTSASFANHCLTYTALYLIGNSFFGWNCLAPWFSYTTRTAIRRSFNLEGSCEALTRHCGCGGSFVEDDVQREQCEMACDFATHVFCHPCSLCQEGREIRRRLPHPAFNAQQVLVMIPPVEQTMGRH